MLDYCDGYDDDDDNDDDDEKLPKYYGNVCCVTNTGEIMSSFSFPLFVELL